MAQLAVLKSRATYIPMDDSYPEDRLSYMLTDSQAIFLLTNSSRAAKFLSSGVECIPSDGLSILPAGLSGSRTLDGRARSVVWESAAYVIYTSGSTGRPKGVVVQHRSLSNLVSWQIAMHRLQLGSVTSCLAAPGFDASVWEIWPALCSGGTLVIASAETSADPEALLSWVSGRSLDVAFLPTPLAELGFSKEGWQPSLKTLNVGGDTLRINDHKRKFSLVNNY